MDSRKFLKYFLLLWIFLRPYPYQFTGNEIIVKIIVETITLIFGLYVLYKLRFKGYNKIIIYSFIGVFFSISIGHVISIFYFSNHISSKDFYDYFLIFSYTIFYLSTVSIFSDTNTEEAQYFIKFIYKILFLIIITNILVLKFPLINNLFEYIYYQKSESNASFGRFRISGTFTNPNHFGIICSFMYTFLLRHNPFKKNYSYIIYLIIFLLGSYFTGSRTSLVIILISSFIYSLKKTKIAIISGLIFISFVLNYENLKIFLSERLTKSIELIRTGGILAIESLNEKYLLSSISLQKLYNDSILFGFGPLNNSPINAGDNQLIFILWKSGIIGFIFFEILIYKIFHNKLSFFLLFNLSMLTGAFFYANQLFLALLVSTTILFKSKYDFKK